MNRRQFEDRNQRTRKGILSNISKINVNSDDSAVAIYGDTTTNDVTNCKNVNKDNHFNEVNRKRKINLEFNCLASSTTFQSTVTYLNSPRLQSPPCKKRKLDQQSYKPNSSPSFDKQPSDGKHSDDYLVKFHTNEHNRKNEDFNQLANSTSLRRNEMSKDALRDDTIKKVTCDPNRDLNWDDCTDYHDQSQFKKDSKQANLREVTKSTKNVVESDRRRSWLTTRSEDAIKDVDYWSMKCTKLSKELNEVLDELDALENDNELLECELVELNKLMKMSSKLNKLFKILCIS